MSGGTPGQTPVKSPTPKRAKLVEPEHVPEMQQCEMSPAVDVVAKTPPCSASRSLEKAFDDAAKENPTPRALSPAFATSPLPSSDSLTQTQREGSDLESTVMEARAEAL